MRKKIIGFAIVLFIIFIGIGMFVYLVKPFEIKSPISNNKNVVKSEKTSTENKKLQNNVVKENKDQVLEALWENSYAEYNARNFDKCISIENQIIAEAPDFYKAYTYKGIAQCFQGDYSDGFANLDKALQINPNYDMGRYNKALGLELDAQYDKAIAEYQSALELNKYVWSYYGIASIYGRRGDINNVVKYLSVAINMDSAVKKVAQDERDFDNVRKYSAFQKLVN